MQNDVGKSDLALIGTECLRITSVLSAVLLIWSAGFDRPANAAAKVQQSMVGMPKKRVLACMGAPNSSTVAGGTEILSYYTGSGTANSDDQDGSNVIHVGASQSRFCKIDIALTRGRVSKVQYSGAPGEPLMAGKQCAYAIENCLSERPGPAIYSVIQSAASARALGTPALPPTQQHACTHEELVQARIATMNGYTGGPKCNSQ